MPRDHFPIEKMSYGAQQSAKSAVYYDYGPKTKIKEITSDNEGRPYLKFILGDRPAYCLMDTGNSIDYISLTKSTAELIGIDRYPKHADGYIIPVTLPDVGSLTLKAFIEDRGANLIQPLHFAQLYDIEFSRYLVIFSENRRMPPAIPYSTAGEGQPIIHVKIGSGAVDLVIDTGAYFNEVSAEVAEEIGLTNYPYVNTIEEDIGNWY